MLKKTKSWLCSLLSNSSPPLCLLSHYEDSATTIVVIKNKVGQIFKERLSKIARSPALVQQFSTQDAHLLGYLLGHEDTVAAINCQKTLEN